MRFSEAAKEGEVFTTMCGHSLIAANLVRKGLAEVAAGRMTPREASLMVGKPRVCGIYNLDKSDAILSESTETDSISETESV